MMYSCSISRHFASLLFIRFALARTVLFDWNITWVQAKPDGLQQRPVIGINGEWPPPVVHLTKGDRVVAQVHNQLGNESTSIHWHGIYQNGTNSMDGPPMVTQCSIVSGASMMYNFTVNQTGTYWYHSHHKAQYADGLRQALYIHDPENPFAGQYDEERVISLSDWYHDQMPSLLKSFISYTNPTGAEPVPKAALINDTAAFSLHVQSGKTYLLHLVNVGAFASQYFWIEGHSMKIVEVDGIWTEPAETNMIYLASAQRYSVLVAMKNDTGFNYPIVASMDTDLFDAVPDELNWNATGWLVYDQSGELPGAAGVDKFDFYDDFKLVPVDRQALYETADYTVSLDLAMNNLGDGANYAMFNGIAYTAPQVPTLYSVLSGAGSATDARVYGTYTNPFVLDYGKTIDIVLNNGDTGKHPFHLHGHAFQVLHRSDDDAGHWDPAGNVTLPSVPMRRDTLVVRPLGNFVVRFKADNPGVWLFHCHIEWHMDSGLAATMVEAPLELQHRLSIPNDHMAACAAAGTRTVGNAAGNTADYLDLTGENKQVDWLPSGFTVKGYVAFAFSSVSGMLGVATIAWYGRAPLKPVAC